MINLLDMQQPIRDLMRHIPRALLDELTLDKDARMYFAVQYQHFGHGKGYPIPGRKLDAWHDRLEKTVMLEMLRRYQGYVINAWPRNLEDGDFWKQIQVSHGVVNLKRTAAA